jgi:predicted nucleic acid-binding protein
LIYLDTSVALAQLFAEDRRPKPELWQQTLVSSRLLQLELWVRLNARGLGRTHADAARQLLARVSFIEMLPQILDRVLEPFPSPVRTLDAIHLASALYLREQAQEIEVATYDPRLADAARRIGLTASIWT